MPRLTLPLVERREIARGSMSFAFDLEGQSFPFKAGQYLSMTLPDPLYQDEKGNTRTFSIASSPLDPFLLIATRMRGSAFKNSLAGVPLGTRVNITGPLGAFTLHQDATRPAGLIAGGIGITPFRSIVKDALGRRLPHSLTLLYANRTAEDAPFLDELDGLAREHSTFRLIPIVTRPEESRRPWRGRTGHIDAGLVRESFQPLERYICYVAGPSEMVDAVMQVLIDAGVREDAIRREDFTGY